MSMLAETFDEIFGDIFGKRVQLEKPLIHLYGQGGWWRCSSCFDGRMIYGHGVTPALAYEGWTCSLEEACRVMGVRSPRVPKPRPWPAAPTRDL